MPLSASMMTTMTYSRFIGGLGKAGIEMDRKVMSDLAIKEPAAFGALGGESQGSPGVTPVHSLSLSPLIRPLQAGSDTAPFVSKMTNGAFHVRHSNHRIRSAERRLMALSDLAALDAVRVAELGKKGRVSGLMKTLGQMSPEERQEMGPKLNALKNRVADAVEARKADAGRCRAGSAAGDRKARHDAAAQSRNMSARCIR